MARVPVTIVTGFLGAGKTTMILKLLTQLPDESKIALLKNEFGAVAVDSELAKASAIAGVQELTNGCICCNLVGQLGDALKTLRESINPDRIIIETSGNAFPATLAIELNRLASETGHYELDGVISVLDVENWRGYEDTSYTARLQARYTDLVVFNKWEDVSERQYEDCLDRLGDLDLPVAHVKSDRGRVDQQLVFGLCASASHVELEPAPQHDHQSEVEVVSVELKARQDSATLSLGPLNRLLEDAPKDEVYRIKALVRLSERPSLQIETAQWYALNWAFGRWTYHAIQRDLETSSVAKMTLVVARDQGTRWAALLNKGTYLVMNAGAEIAQFQAQRIS